MKTPVSVIALRLLHGILVTYFAFCLLYIYYSIFVFPSYIPLAIVFLSLGIEGFIVFFLNSGNCPLIHVQRKIGDPKPFFELLLPPKLAKRAIPIFSILTILGLIALAVRLHTTAY